LGLLTFNAKIFRYLFGVLYVVLVCYYDFLTEKLILICLFNMQERDKDRDK